MLAARLFQNSCEVAPAQADSLLDNASDGDAIPVAGHAASLAVDPDATGTIFQFKNSSTKQAKGTRHAPGDGNLFPCVPAGAGVDLADGNARGASRQ